MEREELEKILVDLLKPIITNILMQLSLNGQGRDLHDDSRMLEGNKLP